MPIVSQHLNPIRNPNIGSTSPEVGQKTTDSKPLNVASTLTSCSTSALSVFDFRVN